MGFNLPRSGLVQPLLEQVSNDWRISYNVAGSRAADCAGQPASELGRILRSKFSLTVWQP
jgi:hypothetical protein